MAPRATPKKSKKDDNKIDSQKSELQPTDKIIKKSITKQPEIVKQPRTNIKYLIAFALLGLFIGYKYSAILTLIEQLKFSLSIMSKSNENIDPTFGQGRIIAVGDLHGDYENALKTMKMAQIVDSKGNWIAGKSIFVQTGDVVDRGDDTIALYKMMMKLQKQAENVGGRVVSLLGNHEVLNMAEVYNWVTPGDFKSFGGEENRKRAWSSNGWIGKYLRQLGIAANINGTVFFHGGASPKWAIKNVDGLNLESTKLLGLSPQQIQMAPLFGDDGPIWYRGFAQDPEYKICTVLEDTLRLFGAKRVAIIN